MSSSLGLPVVHVHPQRTNGDCAVSALAMLTGFSYEDALEAVTSIQRHAHHLGLYPSDIIKAAAKLGIILIRAKRFDLESDTGILDVDCQKGHEDTSHVVLLRWGLIFDTDGKVWEPDAFLTNYEAKAKALLRTKRRAT